MSQRPLDERLVTHLVASVVRFYSPRIGLILRVVAFLVAEADDRLMRGGDAEHLHELRLLQRSIQQLVDEDIESAIRHQLEGLPE